MFIRNSKAHPVHEEGNVLWRRKVNRLFVLYSVLQKIKLGHIVCPGVELRIWLKQGKEKAQTRKGKKTAGKEKRLLARKKDCWQGF